MHCTRKRDSDNPTLKAARDYAARGWRVIVLYSIEAGHCTCRKRHNCGTPGKHPRTQHGVKDATIDADKIREWWKRWPNANVGIATGADSFVAIDIDPRHGGDESLAALEAEHGPLPPTMEALTGGGGRHLCVVHAGERVANTVGKVAAGIDVKGDGGYIVAPPSNHQKGDYRWRPGHGPGEIEIVAAPIVFYCARKSSGGKVTESTESTEVNRCPKRMTEVVTSHPRSAENLLLDLSASGRNGTSLSPTILEAIEATLPTAPGQRNDCVFPLVRALKAIPELANQTLKVLRPIVRYWHNTGKSRGVIETAPFDQTWSDFQRGWQTCRYAAGSDPLSEAVAAASKEPPPAIALEYDSQATRTIVAVCRQLQIAAGDSEIFLSCRSAARITGIKHPAAARILKMLVYDEVLALVRPGDELKASRYRYLGG